MNTEAKRIVEDFELNVVQDLQNKFKMMDEAKAKRLTKEQPKEDILSKYIDLEILYGWTIANVLWSIVLLLVN